MAEKLLKVTTQDNIPNLNHTRIKVSECVIGT